MFVERLLSASQANSSLVCVGLDPDPALMPIADVAAFNRAIVDSTNDLVCAYKPNLAFYEALGVPGLEALAATVAHIKEVAPDVVVIGDAKRGDIDSSSRRYAKALFEVWGFDAATVNGYGGRDAIEPFLEYESKGVFVWCRSSNPGAGELQDLRLSSGGTAMPLYEWVAVRAAEWNSRGNVGLVVGATYPDELGVVRARCPDMPILLPGAGAQQGDLKTSITAGADSAGRNLIVSASRSVLYASRDQTGFAPAARDAAANLRDRINRMLEEEGKGW